MVSDGESKKSADTIKFLCSYGGKILPRPVDGKLRYVCGLTRILAVDRSISFTELMVKLGEFCGYSVELKCQLPNGNLEMLISIKSDEELALLIEEYDRCCPDLDIPSAFIRTLAESVIIHFMDKENQNSAAETLGVTDKGTLDFGVVTLPEQNWLGLKSESNLDVDQRRSIFYEMHIY
ncbi:hypothetical protein GH714_023193 [Hevea brasiliensis]|uniref:PB1 domain-containing protein n=1 Tax=Hevea brasiliensis TaxID=3981 RepID=A0A6A6MEX5_HEVBR|nr:hypothetical protein GH714_023193 [Hevea brasiliensis]